MTQSSSSRLRQAGFGLLECMLMLLLLGGVVVAGYVYLQAQTVRQQAEEEASFLAYVDQKVAGFAQTHQRLPCVDSSNDGLEDCGGLINKGWLPLRTLGLDVEGAKRGITRIRYVVYRTSDDVETSKDNDLGQIRNSYEPVGWNSDPVKLLNVNGFDFCASLDLSAAASDTAAAAVAAGTTVITNVAYGLALPGKYDRSGTGNLFDGHNDAADTALELPSSGKNSVYDDSVRFRTFASLSKALSCSGNFGSLRSMALATDVINEVASQLEALNLNAQILVGVNTVKLTVSVVKTILAGVAMYTAVGTLGTAIGQLVTAIATCAILIGCADIPRASAAVATSVVAVVAGVASLVSQGVAVGFASAALAKVITVMLRSGAQIDPALQDMIDEVGGVTDTYQIALDSLDTSITDMKNRIAQAKVDATNAKNSYDRAVRDLDYTLNGVDMFGANVGWRKPNSLNEGQLALFDAYTAAVAVTAEKQKTLAASQGIAKLATEEKGFLQGNVDSLNTRITTEQAKPVAQQDARLLSALNSQLSGLNTQLAAAEAKRAAAQTDVNAAQTEVNTAKALQNTAQEEFLKVAPAGGIFGFFEWWNRTDSYYQAVLDLENKRVNADTQAAKIPELEAELADLEASRVQLQAVIDGRTSGETGTPEQYFLSADQILRQMDQQGLAR